MSPARMDRVETGIRAALALAEAYSRHDQAALAALVTEDCVWQDHAPAPEGTTHRGRDAIVAAWGRSFEDSPGAVLRVEEVFGLGLRCVLRWTNEAGLRGLDVVQVRGGQICEILTYVKGGR